MAGFFAFLVILFEGEMQTGIMDIRPVMAPVLSLSTPGVLLITVAAGVSARFVLGV